jgi:Bacterial antitoxin of type II TA system, VapB
MRTICGMRTTIRLDDDPVKEAKTVAARQGRTLSSLIEEGLREQVRRAKESSCPDAVELVSWSGGGFRPGVDLDDSAAMQDLLDEGVPPDKLR